MNIIHKLTLKHMKLNKKRTLITIIGVIISVAMATAVSVIVFSLQEARIQDVIHSSGDWHVLYEDVKLSDTKTIADDDNTNDMMLSQDIGYAELEASQNPNKPYAFIKAYNENAIEGMPIDLVAGRFPQAKGEIVVPEHLYSESDAEAVIGQQMTFDIGLRKAGKNLDESNEYDTEDMILDQSYSYLSSDEMQTGETFEKTGKTYTYTVVGVIMRPGFEGQRSPGYTLITYLNTDAMAVSDEVNASVKLNKLSGNIESEALAIAKTIGLDESQITLNYRLLSSYGYSSSGDFNGMLYSLGIILLLIIAVGSISLIYNAFAISIAERSRHLGMLASVGATKKQKRSSVFFESFVVGCISIPLGLIAGIGGIAVTFHFVSPILVNLLGLSTAIRVVINLPVVITSVCVSILTLFISVYIPASRAAKISPIDAIRQTKDVKLTRRSVKTLRGVRKIFGFEGDLALKNLKRNKGRYRATLFSLFITIVLFLSASGFSHYLLKAFAMTENQGDFDAGLFYYSEKETLEIIDYVNQLDSLESYTTLTYTAKDISLGSEQSKALVSKEMKEYLKREYQVENYEEIFGEWHTGLRIITLDANAMGAYLQELGIDEEDFNDNENNNCIITNRMIVNNGYERADLRPMEMEENTTLPIKYVEYQYESGEEQKILMASDIELNVARVTDQIPSVLSYGDNISSPVTVIVSESTLDEIVEDIKDKFDDQYGSYTEIYIKSTSAQTLNNDLKKLFGEDMYGSLNIYNAYEAKAEGLSFIILINVFCYGFIILITAICVANIFNTLSTSIALRKREFAVLKSVGMTPKTFNKMIYFESILYGMKALLYGLPVSLVIMWLIYLSIDSAFYGRFTLPWLSILIAIFSVFIVIGSAMIYSSAKIKRENIVDGLRAENI